MTVSATSVSEVDWDRWTPVWRATLLFIVKDNAVLLIHKKRGFGAGKINGPGGRIEPGETPEEAAIRETREELLIVPQGVRHAGDLFFQFKDGLSIQGWVFRADDYTGAPGETDEAAPAWFPLSSIPYDRMWADDRYWLPHVLAERPFTGRFLFDRDLLLDHCVTTRT